MASDTRPRLGPVFYAEGYGFGVLADGRRCVFLTRRPSPIPLARPLTSDASNILDPLEYRTLPRCPGPEATPAAVAPEADAVAAEYWRVELQDKLDRPKPVIAPGYMLAGKLAYLETRAKLTDRFEHLTPLGLLVIEARGQIYVDWGDDTGTSGPYATAGQPWPDGSITHAWSNAERYDVVVTERWTATWSLGGRTGTLERLVTEGRIEDFEVRQLQAVRNS